MNAKSFTLLLCVCPIAAAACDGGITNGSNGLPPDDANDQTFLVNGIAASPLDHPIFSGIAVHESGEVIILLRDEHDPNALAGALYSSHEGDSFVVWLDDRGFPRHSYNNGKLIVYDNWTRFSVDVAIIDQAGNTSTWRRLRIDASELFQEGEEKHLFASEFMYASLASRGASSQASTFGQWLRIGTVGLKFGGCVGAALTKVGLLVAAKPCGAMIISGILLIPIDDPLRDSFKSLSRAATVLGCGIDWPSADCLSLLLDASAELLDFAEEAQSQREEATRKAERILRAIYASSGRTGAFTTGPSDLFLVELAADGEDFHVGRMRTATGAQPVITDISPSLDNVLWAVSWNTLYRLDPETATLEQVGEIGADNVVALDLDWNGRLYAATAGGDLLVVDPRTARGNVIGNLGEEWTSSGDLAFSPEGALFATLRRSGSANDILATVNVETGAASPITADGDLGFRNVWGLKFVGDQLFGVTTQIVGTGLLIEIDPAVGAAVGVRTLEFQATGAAVKQPSGR